MNSIQYQPVCKTLLSSENIIPNSSTYGCEPYSNMFKINGLFYKTRRQIQYLKDLKYNFNSVNCCPIPPPCPCISNCYCN